MSRISSRTKFLAQRSGWICGCKLASPHLGESGACPHPPHPPRTCICLFGINESIPNRVCFHCHVIEIWWTTIKQHLENKKLNAMQRQTYTHTHTECIDTYSLIPRPCRRRERWLGIYYSPMCY